MPTGPSRPIVIGFSALFAFMAASDTQRTWGNRRWRGFSATLQATEKSLLPLRAWPGSTGALPRNSGGNVFPSKSLGKDPRTGVTRRHHVLESGLQKAVKAAVDRAGIHKRVSCHTFRPLLCHSPARKRRQHPCRAGADGSCGSEDDRDLYSCDAEGCVGSCQPAGLSGEKDCVSGLNPGRCVGRKDALEWGCFLVGMDLYFSVFLM